MRLHALINGIIAAGIVFISLACGNSSTLTRSKAKGLIEASDAFKQQKAKIPLTGEEVKAGIAAGYWKEQNSLFGPLLMLTPQGSHFFAGFEPQIGGRIIDTREQLSPQVMEVTGITDNGIATEKMVEFKWNLNFGGLPAEIQHFFANRPARSGHAALKLFDDGWRIEVIELQ